MEFLSNLVNGISLGSVYAVIALGYTMVYGIARMLNFAHGDIIMVGGYICFIVMTSLGLPSIVGILAAVVVCTILGITIERVAYKPLRSAPSLAVLITAIGVSYLLQNLALLIWGSDPKSFTSVVSMEPLRLFDGSLVITGETIVTIVVSAIIMAALTLFVNRTKVGHAMLAVSEDKGAAQLMGINVNATISLTFAIGSALAAVAGVLLCSAQPSLLPTTGAMPGIKAFVAAVFGGIGSIPGAMIGGVLLGIIEILSKYYISSQISDAIVFAVLIVVLLVRPAGILGKQIREKVWGETYESEEYQPYDSAKPCNVCDRHRRVCRHSGDVGCGDAFQLPDRTADSDLLVYHHGGIAEPDGRCAGRAEPRPRGLYERRCIQQRILFGCGW